MGVTRLYLVCSIVSEVSKNSTIVLRLLVLGRNGKFALTRDGDLEFHWLMLHFYELIVGGVFNTTALHHKLLQQSLHSTSRLFQYYGRNLSDQYTLPKNYF